MECEKHPDSEKLYIEKIDLGEGRIRTIGSGLQPHMTADELLDGQVIVFANLKPKKLGGIPSEGMVLCANSDDKSKCELMRPPKGCSIGERIQLEGNPISGAPLPDEYEKVLNPKKKVENKCLDNLKTDGNLIGTFNGFKMITSKGPIKTKSLKDSHIS
jgi:tRNA-binding EMAP/Myf-like protein